VIQCFYLGDGNFVVPLHDNIDIELAEDLDEIVGERIVVIDDEEFQGSVSLWLAI
jgi:hypothetical protein